MLQSCRLQCHGIMNVHVQQMHASIACTLIIHNHDVSQAQKPSSVGVPPGAALYINSCNAKKSALPACSCKHACFVAGGLISRRHHSSGSEGTKGVPTHPWR